MSREVLQYLSIAIGSAVRNIKTSSRPILYLLKKAKHLPIIIRASLLCRLFRLNTCFCSAAFSMHLTLSRVLLSSLAFGSVHAAVTWEPIGCTGWTFDGKNIDEIWYVVQAVML